MLSRFPLHSLPALPRKPLALAVVGVLATLSSTAVHAQLSIDVISAPTGTKYVPDSMYTGVEIQSTGSVETTGTDAVLSQHQLDTFVNQGTIRSGGGIGLVVDGSQSGTVAEIGMLTNGGVIDGYNGIFNASGGGTIVGYGIGTLTNTGTISGSAIAIDNGGPGGAFANASIGLLHNTGSIVGADIGVRSSGAIGSINNTASGTIAGNVGIQVDSGGSIGRLTNAGVIRGGQAIVNHSTEANAIIEIRNTGLIDGTILNLGRLGAGTFGVQNIGTITTLENRGTIGGAAMGVYNVSPGRIDTIINRGLMGPRDPSTPSMGGIQNDGTIGMISNSSGILGNSFGIVNGSTGTLTAIENWGLIEGGVYGVRNAGALTTLVNNATIRGTTAAIVNEASGTLGEIKAAGGTIEGYIVNHASQPLVISGGSGTSFGTLTGLNGGPGMIDSAAGVMFGTGNVLLNDDIQTASLSGVLNNAATLQINGTRHITGAYMQNPGATLQIGVTDAADATVEAGAGPADAGYGRLVVSNTAILMPGSGVSLARTGSYAFAPGQRFVVIDAISPGTNYNVGTLRYSAVGYGGPVTGTEVYAAGRRYLVLQVGAAAPTDPGTTPTDPGTTPTDPTTPTQPELPVDPVVPAPVPGIQATTSNAYASLAGLARYTGISDAGLLNLYNASMALTLGSAAESNAAGKRLGPGTQASSTRAAAAPTLEALKVIASRTDQLRIARADGVPASGISTGERALSWAGWGQVFGGHANQDARGEVDGFRANYGGLLIGGDRMLNDAWTVGGAFSYTNTRLDSTGDSTGNRTRINAYGAVAYAGYTGERWYANLSAGAILQRYDSTRQVAFTGFAGTTHGEYDGQQYVARLEAGYPLAMGAYTVTPLGSLVYSYMHQDAYTESGGNGAALSVGSTHANSVRTLLGAKFERGFETRAGLLTPFVQLQWSHEYDRSRQGLTSAFAADPSGATLFTTAGARPVGDMAVLHVGATLINRGTTTVTARYGLEAGGGFQSHTGSLQVRKLF
ncbi:autotransporter domain-containing protein [Cupriavidus respiraculi]|uniref:autotransporter outer membrane beta-barrel domain-containing protein n=1 Tax=Cupriavidus respiraculi TaxID=195930 RepID=UPI001C97067D|nr:autotransporter domain-containing protein [Cupriavidus respiraculi]MBY4947777.1 autotransporter domain-containing protein [Cupriavidus respiraculi]